MGEMADYALEEVEDYEEELLRFRTGKMTIAEAIEKGIVDESGEEPEDTG